MFIVPCLNATCIPLESSLCCNPSESRNLNKILEREELKIGDGSIVADVVPRGADYQSWVSEILDERLTYLHAALDMQTRMSGRAGI